MRIGKWTLPYGELGTLYEKNGASCVLHMEMPTFVSYGLINIYRMNSDLKLLIFKLLIFVKK